MVLTGSTAKAVAASALMLALAAAAPEIFAAPPARWESRGPGGGGAMYSPAINPANPNELFVACDMGPEFHSTDGGKSWTTLNFHHLQSNPDCAVRFTRDPDILWALDFSSLGGDTKPRPARSEDGGRTWKVASDSAWPRDRRAYVLCSDYDSPGRAVVSAAYRELWFTRDGGASFERKLRSPDAKAGLHLAGAFFDRATIYLGLGDGLYVSKDNGRNFAKSAVVGIPAGEFITSFAGAKSAGRVRLYCVTHKTGWAGITGGEHGGFAGIYVLEAGQDAWMRKVGGLPRGAEPFFVALAQNDIDTAYVAGANPALSAPLVCKTNDGGEHWADVFRTAKGGNIITAWASAGGDFGWSFPEYALGLGVSPLDNNRVIVTDLGCAHLSDDGGLTWREVYTTLPAPRDAGATVRGAAYSSNGMEMTDTWQLLWFDAQDIFACATDIKGFRSTDGGRSWSFNYTGHHLNTMYCAATDPATRLTYAAASDTHDMYESTHLTDNRIDRGKGLVLFTADKGESWKVLHDFRKPVIWVALDPARPKRLYAAVIHSREGGLYVTDDLDRGAQSGWRKLPPPPRTEGHPFNIRVLNDGAVVCTYAGRRAGGNFTPSSGVFVSADGGQTWEDRSDPRMRYWTKDLVLDPGDPAQNTWYAGVFHAWGGSGQGGQSGLYRTLDRGKSWTLLADSSIAPGGVLNVESCAFDPAHPGEFYFTTEYDGLFYTPDINVEKPTFEPVRSYPFAHPLRVQFNPYAKNEIWVSSFGNGLRVGDTGR